MRSLRQVLAMLLLAFLITGCSSQPKGEYRDPSQKIAVQLPKGWDKQHNLTDVFYYAKDAESKFTFTAPKQGKPTDPKAFASKDFEANTIKALAFAQSPTATRLKVDGHEALRVSFTDADGGQGVVLLVLADKEYWEFSFYGPKGIFDQTVVDRTYSSVRFLSQKS